MTTRRTYDAARGRWREVFQALGVELPKALNQPCPMCGGTDRFSFDDRSRDGDYICRQCGAGRGIKLLQGIKGWDFKQAASEVDAIIGNLPAAEPVPTKTIAPRPPQTALLNTLWASGHLITSDCLAGQYLKRRGLDIDLGIFKGALRGVDHCFHNPTQKRLPALLSRYCDADGKPQQLQRTYLSKEAVKAPVIPNRMWMPGDLAKGGAVRLGPAAREMGVAEGVETALAASKLFGLPVWATTSEGLLREWRAPKGTVKVTVFADYDQNHVGQRAAEVLAVALCKQGVKVEVKLPPTAGTDWNDVLLAA